MDSIVIAGNPKPNSRTLDAATRVATLLSGTQPKVVDVISLGPGLLGWGDEAVKTAVETVASAKLAVFASPTFKGTYTGVLKLFLDQFTTGEGLRGVTAVPLMLGASPAHAMAPDLTLKPVLVELGACCPAPGLYQVDRTYATDGTAEAFVERWGAALFATAGGRTGPGANLAL